MSPAVHRVTLDFLIREPQPLAPDAGGLVAVEGTAAQLRALRTAIDSALVDGEAAVDGDWCAPAGAVVRLLMTPVLQ